jgi:hypothetical protein
VIPGTTQEKPNEASSDEELRRLIEKVLRSSEVTATAVSLIARAKDIMAKRQQQAEANRGPEPNGGSPPQAATPENP